MKYRILMVVGATTFAILRSVSAFANDRIGIFAYPNDYVGCFNCAANDFESIFNKDGVYGSRFHNFTRPPYANVFSQFSMCNTFANNAPTLYIYSYFGPQYVGRISINSFGQDSICNSASYFSWPDGCKSISDLCSEL